jgi:hypothetical protein
MSLLVTLVLISIAIVLLKIDLGVLELAETEGVSHALARTYLVEGLELAL